MIMKQRRIKLSLKKYYDKATEFIESCFDENNNDDLDFETRVNSRIDTIDDELVKNIVIDSMMFGKRHEVQMKKIFESRCNFIKKYLNTNYKFLDFYNELENEINNLKSENNELKERVEWLECELVNHMGE